MTAMEINVGKRSTAVAMPVAMKTRTTRAL